MPWKRLSVATLLLASVLAGCSSPDTAPTEAPLAMTAGDSSCTASAANFALGKKATPALLEQARKAAGAMTARVLAPHDVVTLEYRSDRLNLNTDDSLIITRASCG